MRNLVPCTVLLYLMAVPAFASGGVWCEADDRHAAISFHAPMTRSGGVYALEGGLRFKRASVPAELKKVDLKIDHLRRVTVGPRHVAMNLRRQQAGRTAQFVELEIDVSGANGEYEGHYVAIVHNGRQPTLRLTGAIACGAE